MALRVSALMKTFTAANATTSSVNKSASFDCEKSCCLAINRGQLMPIGLARGYVEKKEPGDDDGAKPIPDVEEFDEKPSWKQRRLHTEGKSLEKQEELKKSSDPKQEATD